MAPKVDSLNIVSNTKSLSVVSKPKNNSNTEVFENKNTEANIDDVTITNPNSNTKPKEEADTKKKWLIGAIIFLGTFALAYATKGKLKIKTPKINNSFTPFDRGELKGLTKELQSFIDKEIASSTKLIQKPKLVFSSKVNSAGMANPLTNEIYVHSEILTSKDFYKLVNSTGRCIDDSDVLWQITGSRSMLEKEIIKQGLKNVEILPLTREERFKIVKSTVAHEAFHCEQCQNMILHPNIGLEKMVKDFLEPFMKTEGLQFKICNIIAKSSWKELLKTGKKLDPNSELAKKTIKQYRGVVFAKRNTDKSLTYKIYTTLPTEKEAYKLEREFAITHNLLI